MASPAYTQQSFNGFLLLHEFSLQFCQQQQRLEGVFLLGHGQQLEPGKETQKQS